MGFALSAVKEHLVGMGHGGTLNKVRNPYPLFERAANNMLAKIDPVETERTLPLAQTIHSDVFNYALASDFKKPIDLIPQDTRGAADDARRILARPFDLTKAIRDKTISIESNEGTKFLRANWRFRTPKVLNSMDGLTANGTWSAVATAAALATDDIYHVSGAASIRFNVVTTGDGIQNTTMSAVDFSDEDEVGDFYVWIYLPSAPTSISARWGNDLTAKYWSSTAQTAQADGTAFKVGWNLIRFPWATATETGTVDPTLIDSFRVTLASAALTAVRVDNITCSIGRPFDLKYYSKYLFKNAAGTWLAQPTDDADVVVLDSDALNIFLYECLIEMAQQMEGTDSAFDITYATRKLHGDPNLPDHLGQAGLYRLYTAEHPSQTKRASAGYGGMPRLKR